MGEVFERESGGLIPLPPTFTAPSIISPLERARGFPSVFKAAAIPKSQKLEDTISVSRESLPSLFESVGRENEGVVAGMTDEEILEEQRMIREEMGLPVGVLKMLEARARKKNAPNPSQAQLARVIAPPVAPLDDEEGTPEYIRRHFFPNEPAATENTSLDWMRDGSASTSTSTATNIPTFDINGKLIRSTPSHIHEGHHHHGSSSSTFTIPSLLSLVSSAVSAQRSTAFQIISRILRQPPSLNKVEWEKFQLEACRSAGWGIRDKNVGTATAAIEVLEIIFESEEKRKEKGKKVEVMIEGKEELESTAEAFLTTNPFPIITKLFQFNLVPQESLDSLVRSLQYIVLCSAGGPKSLVVEELVASVGLLEAITKKCIGVIWPPRAEDVPASTAGISLLSTIVKSSRDRARTIWSRKLVETCLRFFSILPWDIEEDSRGLAYELLQGSIELFTLLGRYGFGTSLRTKGSSLFAGIFSHYDTIFSTASSTMTKAETRLGESWFRLLSIWTTAAIDPHSTEHDIVWTQIDWQSNAIEAHNWILGNGIEEVEGILASTWELLAVWLEGSKVNKGWRGEDERKWLVEQIGEDWVAEGKVSQILEQAIRTITTDPNQEVQASMIISAIRLSTAYEESTNPITLHLLSFDQSLLAQLYSSLKLESTSKLSWTFIRALVSLLPFIEDPKIRLFATFDILPLLGPGDEVIARSLTNEVLASVGNIDLDLNPLEIPSLIDAPILRPFILHAIITASAGRMISPLQPESKDLLLTTSQRPFNGPAQLLNRDWPLFVLNELLRSGTSPVFENLPMGWNSSELELVRAGLGLMRVGQLSKGGRVEAPLLIYDLVKVFMLEKDGEEKLVTEVVESDLFRDEVVQISMEELLKPLMIGSQPTQIRASTVAVNVTTLEDVSTEVSSAPFYNLFTDLVGLYDSISLSHPVFAQMLLPPLSMSYPIDYRRLLWMDYSHLLKTIKVDLNSVISDNPGAYSLSAYLHPIEANESILFAYCEALVVEKVTKKENPFLYFIALHHIASTIFTSTPSSIVARLAGAISTQGKDDLLLDLLRFTLAEKAGERIMGDPECYSDTVKVERVEKMVELVGERGSDLRKRIESIA